MVSGAGSISISPVGTVSISLGDLEKYGYGAGSGNLFFLLVLSNTGTSLLTDFSK
jgi:hypothetical protein